MNKQLKSHRYKNASSRETYEISDAEPELLRNFALILQNPFGFEQQGEMVSGLDVAFMEFTKGHITLSLGWDTWTGCSVFSHQPEGDEYIKIIGDYMDTVLNIL